MVNQDLFMCLDFKHRAIRSGFSETLPIKDPMSQRPKKVSQDIVLYWLRNFA